MKRALAALTTLAALTSGVYGYGQNDRIRDMQTMAQALANVQKGILYNNRQLVHDGIESLKKASGNIEIAPKNDMDYSSTFAKSQAENIVRYANKVSTSMDEGKKHAALTNYTKVLNQCVSCHNKIRKWQSK